MHHGLRGMDAPASRDLHCIISVNYMDTQCLLQCTSVRGAYSGFLLLAGHSRLESPPQWCLELTR